MPGKTDLVAKQSPSPSTTTGVHYGREFMPMNFQSKRMYNWISVGGFIKVEPRWGNCRQSRSFKCAENPEIETKKFYEVIWRLTIKINQIIADKEN